MALIRLHVCPGWSEPLLVAYTKYHIVGILMSRLICPPSLQSGYIITKHAKSYVFMIVVTISCKRGVDLKVNKAESVL